jgi:PAS domain S-box-containing protein
LINISALDKHYARTSREFPIVAGLLLVAGAATALSLSQIWPFLWAIACATMTRADIWGMKQALAASQSPSSQGLEANTKEPLMMVLGFALVVTFVSLPTALILSSSKSLVIVGMALLAAGSTRSASMFAVSRRVGTTYFLPYLIVPASALFWSSFTGTHSTGTQWSWSETLVSTLAILCATGYVWKSWIVRHQAESSLDGLRLSAERERDMAARAEALANRRFEQAPMRIALFDHQGRFISANRAWLAPLEKTEDELIGKTIEEAIPETKQTWAQAIQNALSGQHTTLKGDAKRNRNGKMIYRDLTVQPWLNEDGSIGGAIAYAHDVTDIYEARAVVEVKQARLELALKATKSFIWEADYLSGKVTFDDDAVAFFGEEPTLEMAAMQNQETMHPEDREACKHQVHRLRANGGHGRIEGRYFQPDGSIRWIRSDVVPSVITDGVPTSFVILTNDVTEELSRQEKLVEMMERANLALAEKRKLLEELCGETSITTIATGQYNSVIAKGLTSDAGGSTFPQLFAGLEQILTEIDDRDMALGAAVQQLRDARTSAEAANIAKSQFLANMSHELRTPLNAIIGYTEILIEDAEYEQRADAAKDANKVRNSATHLLGLINEILDLSKIEAGKMDISREPTPLTDVLSDVMASSAPLAAQNNNELILEIDCDRTLALTDGFRLRQCLLNMMSNACKFTQDGKITLRLETIETDENHRWYDISVTDTGIGISEEQQSRLFKPFSQADGSTTRKYGGTGLGLALTREMTHLLGGEIFVVSSAGQGATFTVRIPAIGLEAADVETTMATNNKAPLVLVVDDDPLARALTARSAAALGMSTAAAETGNAALAFCDQNSVDLIVLDLNLPDMDGNDVLAALRGSSKTRDIPVMVVSVDDDRRRSIAAGAQEHLAKPCPSAVLTAAIARLARRTSDPQKANETATKPNDQSQLSELADQKNKKRSA